MKHIYLMIGCPGVGKSTFIRHERFQNSVVLSSDSYIEEYAKEKNSTYSDVFKEAVDGAVSNFYRELDLHLRAGTVSLIIDRTNLTKSSRKQFIDLSRHHGYEIYAIDLNAIVTENPEEWRRRIRSRADKEIPNFVLERMSKSYEKPTPDEGFHYIYIHSEEG